MGYIEQLLITAAESLSINRNIMEIKGYPPMPTNNNNKALSKGY